jgi:hypothetical protein
MSVTTNIQEHLTNAAVYATLSGGIGYLGARIVQQVDPIGACICSAIAGATTPLFFRNEMPLMSKVAGIALLAIAPFKMCELLKINIPFQTCLIISGMTAAVTLFIQHIQQEREYEVEAEKMDQDFKKHAEEMDREFNERARKNKQKFKERTAEMKRGFKEGVKKMDQQFEETARKMFENFPSRD